ncbi:hypothetical protein [Rhizobium sp. RU36D]|uniref:hypothetical protein n=1 Tax=Rhizobium sp. RU36D TaxID=1907415 RepID=UPI0009D7C889|nr:hypothetical protein [Rhizobium sp. RU36D]SMD09179.1 hypothetical protein SAMN05880593_12094 [Rhizobium sp. RU36D]
MTTAISASFAAPGIEPASAPSEQTALLAQQARLLLVLAIGLQLGLMLPSLIAVFIDERTLNGISMWSKPLKFQTSLIVLLGTLVWLLPLIDPLARAARGLRLAALIAALTAAGEILYITIQAARGRASHFNADTAFEATAYSVMGAGATLLVLSSMVFGLYLLARPAADARAGLRLGGGWGLIIGSILTLITAFVLGSGAIDGPGHWVGGIKTDIGGLPLFGWSRSGGDLRVPHFFATHIMQALPLLGLLLDRFAPRLVKPGLIVGALASIAVVAATFLQAVSGQPFL